MSKVSVQLPPALKHGVYSSLGVLPGEDPAEFEIFVKEIRSEYAPTGRSEEDLVDILARLMWRRLHLSTFKVAERARAISASIDRQFFPVEELPMLMANFSHEANFSNEDVADGRKRSRQKVRAKLGSAIELIDAGSALTTAFLIDELALVERMDGIINRYIKQLLMIRGAKALQKTNAGALS